MIDLIRDHTIPLAMSLLPERMDSPEARRMVLAIGLQESRFKHRIQITKATKVTLGLIRGPARGFWQFERAGGVRGVLRHPASRYVASGACQTLAYPPEEHRVWGALADNDVLACIFARLLLFTLPQPLPEIGDVEGAWTQYIQAWRPGKPHRGSWNACYEQAG